MAQVTASRRILCAHRGCYRAGRMAIGWGFGAGLVQWFCPSHFVSALARLDGLLQAARRRAA